MQRKTRTISLMMVVLSIPVSSIGMQALQKKQHEIADEQKKRSSNVPERIVTSQEREFLQADYKNKYGLAEQEGRAGQDRSAVEITDNYAFFGVFDGHGGHQVAEHASKNLWKNCDLTGPAQIGEIKNALMKGFLKTDKELESFGIDAQMMGSTATVAVIRGNMLVVANAGDSRAVLCRNGAAIALSQDHKPDRADEKDRIEAADGKVIFYGVSRVGSPNSAYMLAVSRALGDKQLTGKEGNRLVIPDPEFQEMNPLMQEDEFIILACDGVWDVLSNQQAVDLVRSELQKKSPDLKNLIGADYKQAAQALLKRARAGTNDDLTVIVVGLK